MSIHVRVIEAHNLHAADVDGKSDPYCVIRVNSDKKKKYKTKVVNSSLDPTWNQDFDIPYQSEDDKLLIVIYDHDKVGKDDKICEEIEVDIKDYVSEGKRVELNLKRKNKKKKKEDAGTLILFIGNPPAADVRPVQLRLSLLEGKKLKKMDVVGKSDPYCVFQILGAPETKWKSPTKQNTLNPRWGIEHVFQVPDYNTSVLRFEMFDEDVKSDDKMMDDIDFHVNTFPIGQEADWVSDIQFKNKKAGTMHLKFEVFEAGETVQEREITLEDKASSSSSSSSSKHSKKLCSFTLGSYSSSYSTSFSSYSKPSHTLSSLSSSEKKIHVHREVKPSNKPPKPVRVSESIKGTVISADHLVKADDDGTDSYVTINIISKSNHAKKGKPALKTDVISDTQDPTYNLDFDFEKVKKGDSLDVKVWQRHKVLSDVCIGQCIIPLKNLKENEPLEESYPLQKPPKIPKLFADFLEFGNIKISLTHSVQYK